MERMSLEMREPISKLDEVSYDLQSSPSEKQRSLLSGYLLKEIMYKDKMQQHHPLNHHKQKMVLIENMDDLIVQSKNLKNQKQ